MADFELLAPGGHQELVDEVLDRLDTKADYDGYYAQLTAGAADSLTGRGDGVSASYLYRTTGGDADVADGTATVKSIHGQTVRWNQLYNKSIYSTVTSNGVTFTVNADGSITANGTASGGVAFITDTFNAIAGHKYLVKGCPAGGQAGGYRTYIAGQSEIFPGQSYDFGSGTIATCAVSGRPNFVAAAASSGTTVANLVFRPQLFDLTAMFGAGNEPTTVAEFEALYPEPYYPYDAGSLLPVEMEGIETVGFNQWDEEWERGSYNDSTGAPVADTGMIRGKNPIEVFPSTEYYFKAPYNGVLFFYDEADSFIRNDTSANANKVFTTPANCRYMRFRMASNYGTTYNHDICINLSWSGYRNGEYEPYWKSERNIPATDLRSAGTVYDELTATERITRVGAVDLGTLTWIRRELTINDVSFYVFETTSFTVPFAAGGTNFTCAIYDCTGTNRFTLQTADKTMAPANNTTTNVFYIRDDSYTDADTFKAAMNGVMLHYELATPTTTPIDPPLNLTYRVSDFGTERVMVPVNEQSAPPTMQVVYGLNVVDTVRRLPTEYISHDSFTQFRLALATFLGATITESWDATDGRYEYTITQNGE